MSVRRPARRNPELKASEVLREHHQPCTLPIPVEEIATALGADVRRLQLDEELSGMLVRDRDRRIISVQLSHPPTRQRFTIAHELGHLLMHPGRPYIAETEKPVSVNLRTNTQGYADLREEREANQFAAALLMPADLIQDNWDRFGASRSDLHEVTGEMAQRFDVSVIALKYRIANLGIYPDLETLLQT